MQYWDCAFRVPALVHEIIAPPYPWVNYQTHLFCALCGYLLFPSTVIYMYVKYHRYLSFVKDRLSRYYNYAIYSYYRLINYTVSLYNSTLRTVIQPVLQPWYDAIFTPVVWYVLCRTHEIESYINRLVLTFTQLSMHNTHNLPCGIRLTHSPLSISVLLTHANTLPHWSFCISFHCKANLSSIVSATPPVFQENLFFSLRWASSPSIQCVDALAH